MVAIDIATSAHPSYSVLCFDGWVEASVSQGAIHAHKPHQISVDTPAPPDFIDTEETIFVAKFLKRFALRNKSCVTEDFKTYN